MHPGARRRRRLLALLAAAMCLSSAALVQDGAILRDEATRRALAAPAEVRLRPGATRRLVVSKSRYCLEVWEDGKVAKVFPVALGPSPEGAKERQGDGRTPEGTYVLVPHHPSPGFGSCFYICYPAHHDVERGLVAGIVDRGTARGLAAALDRGRRPPHDTRLGGLILLHGTKDRSSRGLTDTNWTLGCIALENPAVEELLSLYRPSDRPELVIEP